MIKRIIFLVIPLAIFIGIGLKAVQGFFSSFPSSETVIEKLAPSKNIPTAIDMTESFIDNSGSMRGYYGKEYIRLLRILKSHIRERGKYQYYAFSDPQNIIEGDEWNMIEDKNFYRENNTYFDKVLDSISERIKAGDQTAENFLIITDGIQDVSMKQDYSRIVNKLSDLLDSGMFFQLVAIQMPFSGYKYPEGGGFISYKGDSPLFCYILSYQYDFGQDLYKKLSALNLPIKFLASGKRNIHASVRQYIDTAENRDGSRNTLKRFRDELPVTYLVSRSGTGGTLITRVVLAAKELNLDNKGFTQKTPEFCGQCLPIGVNGIVEKNYSKSIPDITITTTGVESVSNSDGNLGIEYTLFFRNWDRDTKTVACDLTFCNWLPLHPPLWVFDWSSDCDNSRECFEGRTPFLLNIINPILNKSMREYTFGYAVIRNWKSAGQE